MPIRRFTIKRKKQIGGSQLQPGPNIYVFYHIYCNKNTEALVKDQAFRIIFSGLYKRANAIKCFLAGDPSIINRIRDVLKTLGSKFHIIKEGPNDKSYERFTLLEIKKHINDDDKFLYLHTKGVSEISHHSGKTPEYENIFWWRTWMEYFLIGQFEKCIEELNTHDIVGINYTELGPYPHFSGNFWWSTGRYYKTLPDQIGPVYTHPEVYIFFGNPKPKHKNMDEGRLPQNGGLYSAPFYSTNYLD